MGWIENWMVRRMTKRLLSNPFIDAASTCMLDVLWHNKPKSNALALMNDEYKNKTWGNILKAAADIVSNENPIMKSRKTLVDLALSTTHMEVLLERDQLFNPSLQQEGISYELHKYIETLAKTDETLREYCFEVNNNIEFLKCAILVRCETFIANLNRINAIRVMLGDCHTVPELDWLQPFYRAMLVYSEDQYRSQLKLPSLIGEFEGLKYPLYATLVINGEKYPNLTWENCFKDQ